MGAKYRLSTLGCKVNQYESQQVIDLCRSLGWTPADEGEPADIVFVNTCAVTTTALRKSRQETRRLSRGGRVPVVVIGCGASADADRLRKLDGVAAVLGHDCDVLTTLRTLLTHTKRAGSAEPLLSDASPVENHSPRQRHDGGTRSADPPTLHQLRDTPLPPRGPLSPVRVPVQAPALRAPTIISRPLPVVKTEATLVGRIEKFDGHQRAFLKVQDGCDAFCTYCIIPQLRPVLRSKPIEAVVDEARRLVRAGHKEIILTGIFLGAYGRDTAIHKRFASGVSPLARLVQAVARVEGLMRLRLSSLEPGDVDDALLAVLTAEPACVPHLHLPLQSGSGEVLRRMNRQYTREAFVAMIDRVRSAMDRPAISTDLIVGFPGETEKDFEASLEMIRHAGFLKVHAFPFSPREKTAAARWQRSFVPPPVVRERMQRVAEVERACSLAYRRQAIGRVERVLVEGTAVSPLASGSSEPVACPSVIRHGRSDRYFEVHFEGDDLQAGDLVPVRIDRVTVTRTHGTCVASGGRVGKEEAQRGPTPAHRADGHPLRGITGSG